MAIVINVCVVMAIVINVCVVMAIVINVCVVMAIVIHVCDSVWSLSGSEFVYVWYCYVWLLISVLVLEIQLSRELI